jgi:hypothetical protein
MPGITSQCPASHEYTKSAFGLRGPVPTIALRLQRLASQSNTKVASFMPRSSVLKPTHKAIKAYYQKLQTYRDQRVEHEGAAETAFQRLLAETGQTHDLTLIPKLRLRGTTGTNIFPDSTLRDSFKLRHGFWEAKDLGDKLDAEISKKIAKGYPLTTTIFENTQTAILYQNG